MIQVLPEETTNPVLPDHYIFFHHLPFQVTARPVSSSRWTIFIIWTHYHVTVMKSLRQLIHSRHLSRPRSIQNQFCAPLGLGPLSCLCLLSTSPASKPHRLPDCCNRGNIEKN